MNLFGAFKICDLGKTPVFVSPFFLILIFIFCMAGGDIRTGAIYAIIMILSLLAHEYGHSKMARLFKQNPIIILGGLGGMTTYDPDGRLNTKKQLAITCAGPLMTALLVVLFLGLETALEFIFPNFITDYFGFAFINQTFVLLNLIWLVFNLLPMIPTDGGHIMYYLLQLGTKNKLKSLKISHIVSMVTSALALVSGAYFSSVMIIIISAMFLFQNYMAYRQVGKA